MGDRPGCVVAPGAPRRGLSSSRGVRARDLGGPCGVSGGVSGGGPCGVVVVRGPVPVPLRAGGACGGGVVRLGVPGCGGGGGRPRARGGGRLGAAAGGAALGGVVVGVGAVLGGCGVVHRCVLLVDRGRSVTREAGRVKPGVAPEPCAGRNPALRVTRVASWPCLWFPVFAGRRRRGDARDQEEHQP